jgi:hypothetical protein
MDSSQHELILKEYLHLNNLVENFDSKSLNIKAWSITLAVAIIGSEKFFDTATSLIPYAVFASLLFWFIDAYWKSFQYANYRRISQIEDYFAGKRSELVPMQITRSWMISYRKGGRVRFLKILFWPHVLLPNGALTLLFSSYMLYQMFISQ